VQRRRRVSVGHLDESHEVGVVAVIVLHQHAVVLQADDRDPVAEVFREGCDPKAERGAWSQLLSRCRRLAPVNRMDRPFAVADDYLFLCVHQIRIRTWSFVLKQRGLCHEGGEEVRENTPIPLPNLALGCAKQSPARYRATTPLNGFHLFIAVHLLACVSSSCFHFVSSTVNRSNIPSHLRVQTDITSMRRIAQHTPRPEACSEGSFCPT